MNTPAKLTAFAATLAVLFGGGALAGGAIGPDRDEPAATRVAAAQSDGAVGAQEKEHAAVSKSHTNNEAHGTPDAPVQTVRGLAVSENGLRVVVEEPELRRGRTEQLRFRVVDERDETVREFEVEHEKRMHLIIARRDLTGFQHLHPEQIADGSWTADVKLAEAGSYRVFADFAKGGESYTLASDLRVDGEADLRALPAPSATSVSDGGYDVRLDAASVRPGQKAELRFTITKDGKTAHTEPYLGAAGHLVALRDGDLAFLHVHPTDGAHGDGRTDTHDDSVGFAATFPTRGSYRLFLQFKHEGRVQTVAFTQEVE